MQHFCADAVRDSKANIGSILRRVDMDPERPFAEGRIHYLDDYFSDRRSVGIGRHDGTEWAKWLVPAVNAPGTMMEVSIPHRVNSRAYITAMASMPALAAK
jgi:hypothetical protein